MTCQTPEAPKAEKASASAGGAAQECRTSTWRIMGLSKYGFISAISGVVCSYKYSNLDFNPSY